MTRVRRNGTTVASRTPLSRRGSPSAGRLARWRSERQREPVPQSAILTPARAAAFLQRPRWAHHASIPAPSPRCARSSRSSRRGRPRLERAPPPGGPLLGSSSGIGDRQRRRNRLFERADPRRAARERARRTIRPRSRASFPRPRRRRGRHGHALRNGRHRGRGLARLEARVRLQGGGLARRPARRRCPGATGSGHREGRDRSAQDRSRDPDRKGAGRRERRDAHGAWDRRFVLAARSGGRDGRPGAWRASGDRDRDRPPGDRSHGCRTRRRRDRPTRRGRAARWYENHSRRAGGTGGPDRVRRKHRSARRGGERCDGRWSSERRRAGSESGLARSREVARQAAASHPDRRGHRRSRGTHAFVRRRPLWTGTEGGRRGRRRHVVRYPGGFSRRQGRQARCESHQGSTPRRRSDLRRARRVGERRDNREAGAAQHLRRRGRARFEERAGPDEQRESDPEGCRGVRGGPQSHRRGRRGGAGRGGRAERAAGEGIRPGDRARDPAGAPARRGRAALLGFRASREGRST